MTPTLDQEKSVKKLTRSQKIGAGIAFIAADLLITFYWGEFIFG